MVLKKISNVSYGYVFFCPGCEEVHQIIAKPDPRGWKWNGSMKKPTFEPSYLVHEVPNHSPRCHSFVRDGKIEFCNDCGHKLAGKTVDLPAWPYEEFGGVDN